MKHIKTFSFTICCMLLFTTCASMKAPIIQQFESIDTYKYVFITPTTEVTYSSSGIVGGTYGVIGASSKRTINPSDVITGILLKQGYIRLPKLNPELLDKTLIVNYGESGTRKVNLGTSKEITIQFLSARTYKPICVCTAEGQGSTEVDDVRIAINRALGPLFNNK